LDATASAEPSVPLVEPVGSVLLLESEDVLARPMSVAEPERSAEPNAVELMENRDPAQMTLVVDELAGRELAAVPFDSSDVMPIEKLLETPEATADDTAPIAPPDGLEVIEAMQSAGTETDEHPSLILDSAPAEPEVVVQVPLFGGIAGPLPNFSMSPASEPAGVAVDESSASIPLLPPEALPAEEPFDTESPSPPVPRALLAPGNPDYEIGSAQVVLPPDDGEKEERRPTAVIDIEPISAVSETPISVEPTPPPTPPVVGELIVSQLRGGSAPLVHHLVSTFLKEAPARIGELATMLNRGDHTRARQVLSSLSTITGLLSAERMSNLVQEMDRDLATGSSDQASGRLGGLEAAFLEVRLAVEEAAHHDSPEESPPPVSASFLDQLRSGRASSTETLAVRLALTFQAEIPARLADLDRAMQPPDYDAIVRVAQTLSGMCGLIGAEPMAALANQLESSARLAQFEPVETLIERVREEYRRVEEAFCA
jgi:HPt (histidine-containing phosphotransfer) domain-containing protein